MLVVLRQKMCIRDVGSAKIVGLAIYFVNPWPATELLRRLPVTLNGKLSLARAAGIHGLIVCVQV